MSDHRVYAPEPHPDWFWVMSGGVDSTAAFLLTRDALHENYQRRPVMAYWDTGIGLPLNRLYLERLADVYGEMLTVWRTHENFEDRVGREGCPAAPAHGKVRNELKGRQFSKLNTLADYPVHVLGLRAEESQVRARMGKVEQKRRHVEVRPVHRLTRRDCVKIILRHENCPINPCWLYRHPSDCFCLAHGDPSELDRAEERFPWFVQRMREIEEAAQTNDVEGGLLGWGGLTGEQMDRMDGADDEIPMCGAGCGRERYPDVIEAFEARLDGASSEEAIALLEDDGDDEPEVVEWAW